jgi:cytidylate kinase
MDTNPIIVIALCGEAGSGKSSVAKYLRERCTAQGKMFRMVSCAAPLKRMCMDIWGFSSVQVFGDAVIKEMPDLRTGITPRWAMQKLGQAARDHMGASVWLDITLAQMDTPGMIYIIDDLRYMNEAAAIANMESAETYVLRLNCSDTISMDDGTHPSEAQVRKIPDEHLHADIHGSLVQGLPHLFGEVDKALKGVLTP